MIQPTLQPAVLLWWPSDLWSQDCDQRIIWWFLNFPTVGSWHHCNMPRWLRNHVSTMRFKSARPVWHFLTRISHPWAPQTIPIMLAWINRHLFMWLVRGANGVFDFNSAASNLAFAPIQQKWVYYSLWGHHCYNISLYTVNEHEWYCKYINKSMHIFRYLYTILMTYPATIAALPCFHCFHFDNHFTAWNNFRRNLGTFERRHFPLRAVPMTTSDSAPVHRNVEMFQVVVWPVVSQRKKPRKKVDGWRWQEIIIQIGSA